MDASGGVAAVQARIAQIRSRFATPTGGRLGAGLDATSSGTDLSSLSALGGVGTLSGTDDFSSRLQGILNGVGGTGAGTGTGTPALGKIGPSGVDHVRFANDLLDRLGFPKTAENVRAIDAWARAEGTRASNNPLATTQGWAGATKFNSVGVRNYLSYEDGLAATVKTLNNGYYPNILAALRSGTDALAVGRAVADSPWGTGEGVLRVLGSR